jgi:hypothetical protein
LGVSEPGFVCWTQVPEGLQLAGILTQLGILQVPVLPPPLAPPLPLIPPPPPLPPAPPELLLLPQATVSAKIPTAKKVPNVRMSSPS